MSVVLLITFVVMALAAVLGASMEVPVENGIVGGAIAGVSIASFEEYYFQQRHGRWLRLLHPLATILKYSLVIILIIVSAIHLVHIFLGRVDELLQTYERLHSLLRWQQYRHSACSDSLA